MIHQDAFNFSLEYDIDKYGLIVDPGKFERQTRLAPYLWLLSLESLHDDLQTDDPYHPDLYVFNLSEEEQEVYAPKNEYSNGIEHALMWSDDQGNVTAVLVEKGEYDEIKGA